MGGWQESPWREFAKNAALGGMPAAEAAERLKETAALTAGKGNDMGGFLTPQQEFEEAYARITRPGARDLLEWLAYNTDFFTAPASTKYHGAHCGGLVEHSLNVYYRLRDFTIRDTIGDGPGGLWPECEETVAIIALLHDICKVNCYIPEAKRWKNPASGKWEECQGYTFRDPLPLGHGEKSVYLINQYMALTPEEAMAIRWHMGMYTAMGAMARDLDAAMAATPWVWRIIEADMCAARIDEMEDKPL